MQHGRHLTIPINCAAVAIPMWAVATGLMLWDIFGAHADIGRAALLVGLIATCCTISALLVHHRRVVLEVMNYEFRLRDDGEEQDDGPSGYLMPVQTRRPIATPERTRIN